MCIDILIVDDHKLFRKGLRRILELEPDFRIVGEAGNSVEAMSALNEVHPDVILMDINMPGGSGIEATRLIKARYPEVNILVLAIHDDTEYLFEVVRAGASGYLLKDVEPLRLCEAIRTVAGGGSVVNPGLGDKLM
ncbi:MAG: response regulator transcription factor, partial [Firmicutes bacterium]|nr:response regulator transcription factor [Bacillota bacterium]